MFRFERERIKEMVHVERGREREGLEERGSGCLTYFFYRERFNWSFGQDGNNTSFNLFFLAGDY